MNNNEFAKAIDICEKLDFFDGQRAGRELWKSFGTALYCPTCAKKITRCVERYEDNLINILNNISAHYELVPIPWRE